MATATTKTAAKPAAKTTTATTAKPTDLGVDAFKSAEEMTAAAQDQFKKMVDMFTGNADDMREQAETVADEMRARFEKTQKQVADANADIVEAAREEISGAVQFANDLAQAKTFADALTLQQNYWTGLFQNRLEMTQELTQNAVDAARENLEPVDASFGSFFDQKKMFDAFFPAKA